MSKPRDNFWIRTRPILDAIIKRLEETTWEAPGGAPTKAFESVFSFDMESLDQAEQDMVGLDNRFAMIVYGGDRFEGEVQGVTLTQAVHRNFLVLVSDRNIGDRQAAMKGTDNSPGAMTLCDLVAEQMQGSLPVPSADAARGAASRAWVLLMGTAPATISRDGKDKLPGRAAMAIHLQVHCGESMTDLGGGPGMNATDELVALSAKAGVDFETQFLWADVDDSTDPATETPVDLTGYGLTMRFRRRAGEEDALVLTSEDDGGIDLTDGEDGVIGVEITETQIAALIAVSKRWAWRLDGTSPGGKKYPIAEGYLDVADWPQSP